MKISHFAIFWPDNSVTTFGLQELGSWIFLRKTKQAKISVMKYIRIVDLKNSCEKRIIKKACVCICVKVRDKKIHTNQPFLYTKEITCLNFSMLFYFFCDQKMSFIGLSIYFLKIICWINRWAKLFFDICNKKMLSQSLKFGIARNFNLAIFFQETPFEISWQ